MWTKDTIAMGQVKTLPREKLCDGREIKDIS